MSEEWVASQGGRPLWDQEDSPAGDRMRALVNELDEPYKSVIELRMWGQYTFSEIAKELNLASRGSANVMYTRAIKKLRKEMMKG